LIFPDVEHVFSGIAPPVSILLFTKNNIKNIDDMSLV